MRTSTRLVLWLLVVGLIQVGAVGPAEAEDFDRGLAFKGQADYNLYCRSCHGDQAHGDGTVAEFLKVPPADLTRIAERNDGTFPADRVRAFIDGRDRSVRPHGGDMPIWGDAFEVAEGLDEATVEAKIDQLVHYLASIQAGGD